MIEPLRLREMTRDDLAEVVRIENASHLHPWSANLLGRELDHEWSRCMVAEDAGHLVAYIVYWHVHDEVHVLNVATDPAHRRRGAGRRLMEHAEAEAVNRGAVLSTLEVRRSNVPAIRLYETMGYRQVGLRKKYYEPDGEDAIVMLKDLPPRDAR